MKPSLSIRITSAQVRLGCGTARIVRKELDEIAKDTCAIADELRTVGQHLPEAELGRFEELVDRLASKRHVGEEKGPAGGAGLS